MTESNHFLADFEPQEDAIWGVEYSLDLLVDGNRQQWNRYRAALRSTGDIEDVLKLVRDAWIGKALYSPGCNEPGCTCDGEEQTAKVLGVKFKKVEIMARLTDLGAVVAHAVSRDKEKGPDLDD